MANVCENTPVAAKLVSLNETILEVVVGSVEGNAPVPVFMTKFPEVVQKVGTEGEPETTSKLPFLSTLLMVIETVASVEFAVPSLVLKVKLSEPTKVETGV